MAGVTDAYTWADREMIGADGEKIGTIKEIYEDSQTGRPEWALVSTGLLGARKHFVPLAGADAQSEAVRVEATKEQVKAAPGIEGEGQLSEDEERRLFEHYGVPYTGAGSTTAQGMPGAGEGTNGTADAAGTTGTAEIAGTAGTAGAAGDTWSTRDSDGYDTSGPTTDEAMTRSEEELRVGTTSRERGRARLRKYVVTEEVQTTVPVQREEVRLEHEPITDTNASAAMDGPEISEEEHEVVLHEEQPVVEKRVVPKERVRLGKETVTDEQAVNESVRKEQIEPDGEALGRDIDER
jgi:uncharacterized protein (TIGR02271 family)